MIRAVIHMILHVLVPGAERSLSNTYSVKPGWFLMLVTMLVDLDHLLADPIYNPDRCSIGFHPLHQYPIMIVYAVLAAWKKTRLIGLGLIIHMVLDGLDCLWMQYET